jgi:hypothetical protein
MMYAIIDRKVGLVARVYEKRLTGRFALPEKKISRFLTRSGFIGDFAPKTVKSSR